MLSCAHLAQSIWQLYIITGDGNGGASLDPPNPDAELVLAARQLAHLLNNQLTVALGYSELLLLNPAVSPTLLPQLQEIYRATTDAAQTLDQLHRLVRSLSAGEGDPLSTPPRSLIPPTVTTELAEPSLPGDRFPIQPG